MPHPTLLDIGVTAYTHQAEVDELRQRLNIPHNYFDCWLYGFLENKKFNVEEAVSKIRRREAFEREQIAQHTMTDWMLQNMRKGIAQFIGNDKEGRVVLYVVTARDKPTASRRAECKMSFDMMLSYGTRLRADSKRCQMVMLINQEKASLWSNVDMTFQADIALRIAKFFPGAVDKMYICNMNRTLAAVAKPIFSRLPAIVSDRIIIISDSELKAGRLLEYFDESVLPVALGGSNDCDRQENYTQFSVAIKEHFEQMKCAVLRGLSVKEWELACLFPHGLPEDLKSFSERLDNLSNSALLPNNTLIDSLWSHCYASTDNSICPESLDVVTCDTIEMDCFCAARLDGEKCVGAELPPVGRSLSVGKRDFIDDYVEQFVLLESFFRGSIAETAEREWLSILQREVLARSTLSDAEQNMGKNTALFRRLPVPLRLIARGCLWLALMVMSFYFLIGSFFGTLFISCFMNILFFSMFIEPYKAFPYGCALLVTGCHCALFCSRGIELARRTYNGELVDAFRFIGPRALLMQALACVAALIAFFVVFCVMASRYDVVSGIQYSMATGWIVAVCIILLYHFLYAFGVTGYYKSLRKESAAVATLYFFLDVDMDANQTTMRGTATIEVAMASIVAMAALAFGLSYVLDGSIFFLCATVTTTFLIGLFVVLFLNTGRASSTDGLLTVVAFYSGLTWLTIVFTTAAHGWQGRWGTSLVALLALALVTDTVVILYTLLPVRNRVARRWMFRALWVWIISQFIAFLALAFISDYRLGVITIILGVHLILHGMRVGGGCSNYGLSIVVFIFLSALLFCIVGGWSTAQSVYKTPASNWLLPNYTWHGGNTPVTGVSLPQSLSFLPVCLVRFSSTVDIVGMALFAKLSDAGSLDVTLADLHRWFPNFRYVYNDTFLSLSFLQTKIFTSSLKGHNTTIVTLGTTDQMYPVMESMTIWINVVALSLLALITPSGWFVRLVSLISAADGLSALLWNSSIDRARDILSAYVKSIVSPTHDVYFVGHGLAGAAAAFFVSDLPDNVHSVTFASPLSAVAWRRGHNWMSDELSGRVFSVVSSSSLFSLRWMWGGLSYMIPCHLPEGECSNIDSMARLLDALCGLNTKSDGN
ncbi:hypothetical protein TCSYLVIO_003005 [Trypanosoma cruzi]|nr:hypothetical protein TCSYLVIO_003005 [Trypanosoma cruzi]